MLRYSDIKFEEPLVEVRPTKWGNPVRRFNQRMELAQQAVDELVHRTVLETRFDHKLGDHSVIVLSLAGQRPANFLAFDHQDTTERLLLGGLYVHKTALFVCERAHKAWLKPRQLLFLATTDEDDEAQFLDMIRHYAEWLEANPQPQS